MPESLDPYTYPGSRVLGNLPDLRDQEALDHFEANAVWTRLLKLDLVPWRGNFDVAHLKAIHKYLFQDVFAWAGEFRTVDISKGGSMFARVEYIETCLKDLLKELPRDKFLRGRDRQEFSDLAGFYLMELNAIHPFREGNGRTQREFIRELGAQAGFQVDWRRVSREQMIIASRLSFASGSSVSFAAMIRHCIC